MKAVIIFAHPNPASFNAVILAIVQQTLADAGVDLLVFIHQIWWFSAPAIIKGYVDRTLTNGFAFQLSPTGPLPLMTGKKAFIVQTGGNTLAAYEAYNLTGVPQGVLE